MRILLLASMIMIISSVAQACTPSDGDFKSLAASPSHLTPSDFSALAPERQAMVCSTRAFIKKIDAQRGVMTEMEKYSIKYLSPAENDRMSDASDRFLAAIFKSKGL